MLALATLGELDSDPAYEDAIGQLAREDPTGMTMSFSRRTLDRIGQQVDDQLFTKGAQLAVEISGSESSMSRSVTPAWPDP